MSFYLLINNSHIYIYIYIERERERERNTHMLWWLPNDVQYILFKHTTYIMFRIINLEFQVSHYLISRVFHK